VFSEEGNDPVFAAAVASGMGQLRGRLLGNDDGDPMIFCFSSCVDSIRTIPVLQHDPDRWPCSTGVMMARARGLS
jgi:hypothetical protein